MAADGAADAVVGAAAEGPLASKVRLHALPFTACTPARASPTTQPTQKVSCLWGGARSAGAAQQGTPDPAEQVAVPQAPDRTHKRRHRVDPSCR